MDDLIYLMNIQYMYMKIYLMQVVIIQKNYRMFKDRSKYLLLRSIHKNKDLIRDIKQLGFMPPMKEISLLRRGGYIYRESLRDYEKMMLIYKNKVF